MAVPNFTRIEGGKFAGGGINKKMKKKELERKKEIHLEESGNFLICYWVPQEWFKSHWC